MERPINVLVTGAGAPGIGGTVFCLRNNPDEQPVNIMGVDTNAEAVGRYLTDSFALVPPPEDDTYLNRLLDICEAHRIDAILPQTTREIARLSTSLDIFEQRQIPVMVSSSAAIERANDKYAVVCGFQALGLPTPRFAMVRNRAELLDAAGLFGYPSTPIVVKPPVSNGMRGVRVVTETKWDVQRFLREKPSGLEIGLSDLLAMLETPPDSFPPLLVTEFLPGPEFTVDVFRGAHGAIALPRAREVIRSGITFSSRSIGDERLRDYSLRGAEELDLKYAFGFQFKLDAAGVPKILECNPRIQGTMVASYFSGFNVIWMGLKELLGERVGLAESVYRESRFVRFWGGVGVTDGTAVAI
ncbi:MAG: ATP-grasp domain-containing protein [Candidatus Eremiobacteraeota bacterium]|nr:ATP-grasp domain-containing protein [Candidatus Eremiobacteraeota bacterium]